MRDQIITQLKAKLVTLGVKNLSNTRINAIADKLAPKITEESQIDDKLDELNELFPFAEIAKQDDQLRTLSAKAQKDTTTSTTSTTSTTQVDETPEWAKALLQKVETLEKEKTQTALQQKLQKAVTDKKIPAILLKGRTLESEDQLEAVVAEIEADHLAYKQELTNQGFSQSSAPVGGATTLKSDSIEADIKAWTGKSE